MKHILSKVQRVPNTSASKLTGNGFSVRKISSSTILTRGHANPCKDRQNQIIPLPATIKRITTQLSFLGSAHGIEKQQTAFCAINYGLLSFDPF